MLTLPELEEIATGVIGVEIRLGAEMAAPDVPGWDSLNNTLVALEISSRYGIPFTGEDAADCATFGDLLKKVNTRIGAGARA